MERLAVLDAAFLAHEDAVPGAHTHIGPIMVFEGPVPTEDELRAQIASRLHLVPRYRQRLAESRFGRPFWVEDTRFNLDYHLRWTSLPAPGGEEELRTLCGKIFSQRLDRSKPLWELYLVDGLAGDRFAVIKKTHHCLVDAIGGLDLTRVLFDLAPGDDEDRWSPPPEPRGRDLLARDLVDAAAAPVGAAREAVAALGDPGRILDRLRGIRELVGSYAEAAPRTPLNVPIGPHRRIELLTAELDDFKRAKNALGGTINDVFLTVISGALGSWLADRGETVADLELRALVPLSVRTESERHDLANKVAGSFCRLPVHAADPLERHELVMEAMAGVKESKQALGTETLIGLERVAPSDVFAQATRLNFSSRLSNLLVSNIPGPQFQLHLLGRPLAELYPVPFLVEDNALAVAMLSYDGRLYFCLLGEYEAMPDLGELRGHLAVAIEELLAAAGVQSAPADVTATGRERSEPAPPPPPR